MSKREPYGINILHPLFLIKVFVKTLYLFTVAYQFDNLLM